MPECAIQYERARSANPLPFLTTDIHLSKEMHIMATVKPISDQEQSQEKKQICAHCGDEFTGRKRKYCSKDCLALAFGHNPHYKPEPFCLTCNKPLSKGRKKYCSERCCQIAYERRKGTLPMEEYREKRKPTLSRKEREKVRRDELSDVMVKKTIYIGMNKKAKGTIAYTDITDEMIKSKRAELIAFRKHGYIPKKGPRCKVFFKKCKECGNSYTAKNRLEEYCSDKCSNQSHLRNIRKKYRKRSGLKVRTVICAVCGEEFKTWDKRRNCCSSKCGHKHAKRQRRSKSRDAFVENISISRLFFRDQGRCQLCGKKLNLKRQAPHPLTATVDHIIPLSKNGEHSYKNVQLACFSCNSKKGDRLMDIGEQLRIF